MRVAFQWLNAVLEVFMEIYYGCVTCACYFVIFFLSHVLQSARKSVASEGIAELAACFWHSRFSFLARSQIACWPVVLLFSYVKDL